MSSTRPQRRQRRWSWAASIGVEAGFAAAVFKFFDQAHPGEQVEIPVNCAQAYFWQPPPDEFM